MINRHLNRTVVLQTMFELDSTDNLSASKDQVSKIVNKNLSEFAVENNKESLDFILNLIYLIQERLSTIDDIITRAAPQWPLENINSIDRNILRIGLAELLFNNEQVPPKVAIDESIELSKTYSGTSSYKFINGVLGNIYKEMGQPRKDEITQKASPLEVINCAGAVVYSIHNNKVYFALVKDIFKHWTLSKGRLLEKENEIECCMRGIKEEIGLNVVLKDRLEENSYIANSVKESEDSADKMKNIEKIRKHVVYFLAEAKYQPLHLEESSTGLLEAKWFTTDELKDIKMYNDIKPIMTKALLFINKKF